MRVRILGPLEVLDGTDWRRVGAAKQRALLTALIIPGRGPVSIDRLVEEIWEGRPPATAVNVVQGYVAAVRRLLGDAGGRILRTQTPGYELVLPDEDVDARRFEALVERGREALGDGECQAAADLLTEAEQLWRGQPFVDVRATVAVEAEGERLEQLRLAGLEARIDADLELGRHAALVPELRRLIEVHPLAERFWAQLMLAFYRGGRQAEALGAYQRLYRLLDDELGVEPTRAVGQLHQQLLNSDPALDLRRDNAVLTRAEAVVPRQLPAGIGDFTGRVEQFAQLDALLPVDETGPAPAVVISAITGTAGIGKTTLAVHWGHRVADWFPDGQLYVNLRGFDPTGQPVSAAEAIHGFLTALGVLPEQIPARLEEQVGLYRSLLADRRILLVLDNARDSQQVRSLLPGAPGCLVVVTSRDQLTGLVGREGAQLLQLDLFTAAEARELLARRLGVDRTDAEPRAVEAIAAACARLPLALAVVAARVVIHPDFPLQALAGELVEAGNGLDAFAGAGPETGTAADIRAVFSWSYRQLSQPAARLFRLLSLHPGPDISAPAAASLAGVPPAEARTLLAELTRVHLLNQHQPGRYSFHDLLRTYSSELTKAVDAEATRSEAIRRVLDHYLHTAFSAAKFIEPSRLPIPLPPSTVASEVFVDRDQASSWLAAEDQVLTAAVQLAAEAGFDLHAWQLVWCLAPFHDLLARWRDQVNGFRLALEAATRAGDPFGQAHAHCGLGVVHTRLGNWARALPELQQAIELFGGIGDSASQAHGHYVLSAVLARLGHHERAISQAEQAIKLFQHTDQPVMQARALDWLGWARAERGHHQDALHLCQQALEIQQELGDRLGAASTWDTLGHVHHLLEHYDQAAACYRQALAGFRDLGDPFHQADALCGLGDTHQAVGAYDAAVESWQASLNLLQQIGHQRANEVRTRLAQAGLGV